MAPMRGVIAAVGASLMWAAIVSGQGAPTPAPGGKGGPIATTRVSGTIKSLDPAGRTVLLSDGTRLVIPESVGVNTADLKPGVTVQASVEKKGGQNVVTAIQVHR